MCLIAHRTKPGSHIPNNVIELNKWMNPDGFGLMWRDGKDVRFAKYAPDEFEFFRNQLKALDATDVEYAAHWRNATSGAQDKEMAHPYEYVDADGTPIVAMHNGIINIKAAKKDESDTYAFVYRVLATLKTGWWNDSAMRFLVDEAVGWSRLLLFTPDESVYVNPSQWTVEDAVSYSTDPVPVGMYVPSKKHDKQMQFPPSIWDDGFEWDGYDYGGPTAAKDDPSIYDDIGDQVRAEDADIPSKPVVWFHDKHLVEPVEPLTNGDITVEEDIVGSILCTECGTIGEFYVIDGSIYVDVVHDKKPSKKKVTKKKVTSKKNPVGFIPLPEGTHIPTGEPATV